MSGRIIEAKAVISAADKTANVFDKIASKLKGVEKSARALESVKAPKLTGRFLRSWRGRSSARTSWPSRQPAVK
jgi:hypothetical protein